MKIAIVRLSALGDVVFSSIFPYFIKKTFPHAHITWIIEEGLDSLLHYSPYIDDVKTVALKQLKKHFTFSQLIKEWKHITMLGHYDIVFDLQGLIKSAIVAKLIPSLRTIGYDEKSLREPWATLFYNERFFSDYAENIVLRYQHLFENYFSTPIEETLILHKPPLLQPSAQASDFVSSLCNDKKMVLLIVGASTPQKLYPKEHFITLAKELRHYNLIAVWGNEEEKQKAIQIAQHAPVIIAPALTLDTLKALVNYSDLVIGTDTGPVHLAWALNRPSITLFGNTPASRNTYSTTINKTLSSMSLVNPKKIRKDDFSVRNIQPQQILSLAHELLK